MRFTICSLNLATLNKPTFNQLPAFAHLCLQEDRTMYGALECCAQDAIGPGGSWASVMDSGLVNNLGESCCSMWTTVTL